MRIPPVIWVAIGAVVLWMFFRPKATPTAQGSIQSIQIDGAPMGSHAVPKVAGGTVQATMGVTGLTKNFQGIGITWRYQVRLVIQQEGVFFWTIGPGGPVSIPFNTNQSVIVIGAVPANTPSGLYSVTAVLLAEDSTANGAPTGTFSNIPGAFFTHPNAISVGAAAGPAVPAGSVFSVDVAQAILRQMNRE
mgnify:CR=1 FL=1